MAEVQERLEARFSQLDPTVVAAAIQIAAAGITGPVRDFVPLLVERSARERLNRALDGETTTGDAGRHDVRLPGSTQSGSAARPEVDVSPGL
jgi:hypothetical protein